MHTLNILEASEFMTRPNLFCNTQSLGSMQRGARLLDSVRRRFNLRQGAG